MHSIAKPNCAFNSPFFRFPSTLLNEFFFAGNQSNKSQKKQRYFLF